MLFSSLLLLLAGASAHPGDPHEDTQDALLARRSFLDHVKREENSCNALSRRSSEKVSEKHLNKIAELRREVQAKKQKRDTNGNSYESIDHESDRTDITADISLSDLFTSDDATCLLQPETTEGPYYVTGELIRDDITEDQQGIPLHMAVEVFDTNTCEPLSNVYLEFWHCNAVGIYSGVKNPENGDNVDNRNATWLRGLAETNDEGAIGMQTIFPGHYPGRATHIHIIAHKDPTVFENGTIGSGLEATGTLLHVGQLYFDQDLIKEADTAAPYNTNDAEITLNSKDMFLARADEAGDPDPFFKYVKLGDNIADGLYVWVSLGIDSSASYHPGASVYYGPDGGHDTGVVYNPNSYKSGAASQGPSEIPSASADDGSVAGSSGATTNNVPSILTIVGVAAGSLLAFYL